SRWASASRPSSSCAGWLSRCGRPPPNESRQVNAMNMPPATVLHYSAFTADGRGGNPAGVVLDARGMDAASMQGIAAELGYSETAFLMPLDDGSFDIRYYSPLAEVAFCGHATIAAAVAH